MLPRVVLTTVLILMGGLLAPAPANGALTNFMYVASAGATKIKALNGAVTSDETALSAVVGGHVPNSDGNTVLTASAAGLLDSGSVTTTTRADPAGDGVQLTSISRTEGLSLLNGAITAKVVETTGETTMNSSTTTSTATTKFVDLHVAGVNLPVNLRENLTVTIPGVATVIINGVMKAATPDGAVAIAYGLGVALLKPAAGHPAGTSLFLNPTYAAIAPDPVPEEGPALGGAAYATRVSANVGDTVKVWSGPTARVGIPATGTSGNTKTNSTAAINLPNLLTTGVVESTAKGTREPTQGEAVTSTKLVGLNLLGGLIRADVVKVESRSTMIDGVYKGTLTPTFLNLKVGSIVVPANVAPNTTINVAGLGRVVVNHQIKAPNASAIRGLLIILDTSRAGLPAGARIEVAVASSAAK